MAFTTHATFRGRYFYRAGSCFLEVADPGREIIPPACSEVGRAVAKSALAFFSVLRAPLPSYSRPGPPETMLAMLDSWLLKKGVDQRAWLMQLHPTSPRMLGTPAHSGLHSGSTCWQKWHVGLHRIVAWKSLTWAHQLVSRIACCDERESASLAVL